MEIHWIEENRHLTLEELRGVLDVGRARMMNGTFLPPEKTPAIQAVEEYRARCDAYDDGLPVSPGSYGYSNRHAIQVRDEVCRRNGLTHEQFHEALRTYDLWYGDGQCK